MLTTKSCIFFKKGGMTSFFSQKSKVWTDVGSWDRNTWWRSNIYHGPCSHFHANAPCPCIQYGIRWYARGGKRTAAERTRVPTHLKVISRPFSQRKPWTLFAKVDWPFKPYLCSMPKLISNRRAMLCMCTCIAECVPTTYLCVTLRNDQFFIFSNLYGYLSSNQTYLYLAFKSAWHRYCKRFQMSQKYY